MFSYKTKLLKKINTRNASILFIGQNEFSQNLCLSFADRGFQTYFYSDNTLTDVNKLLSSGVHITGLVYDFYDVDVVILSKPKSLNDSNGIDYLAKSLSVLKLMFHNGMLFVVDEELGNYSKDGVLDKIRTLAYLDPAEPVVEACQDGLNFFYCEFGNSGSSVPSEIVKAKNSDSLQLGVELIKGSNLK